MKFSEYMLTALKNFSTINASIILQPGKVQRTISSDKTILAEAEFDDDIPNQFGIYDLNEFLANYQLLPDLSFQDKAVIMSDGNLKLKYNACAPNLILSPPDKELSMKQIDTTFTILDSFFSKIQKIAAMNSFPHVTVKRANGELSLIGHDRANDLTNSLSYSLGEDAGDDFSASFKTENLKLIPSDYTVDVMIGGFARFTSQSKKLKYFIALESTKK